MRLIDAEPIIEILKDEYEGFAKEFDDISIFKDITSVAVYGALMQEVDAIIGLLERAERKEE